MTDQAPRGPSDAELARAAFIQSVVSNLAMLAVLVAVNVAVAKRDAIVRAVRRAAGNGRHGAAQAREARELAAFRRDVADISHAVRLADEP